MQLSTITSLLVSIVLLTALPQTGGSMLTWLLWIGGALIVAALILLLVRGLKNRDTDE